jgi:serine protease Do
MTPKHRINPALVGELALVATLSGLSVQAATPGPVNPPLAGGPVVGAPASFADLVQRVAPAVVSIDVEAKAIRQAATLRQATPADPEDSGPGMLTPFGDLRRFFPQVPPQGPAGPMRATGSGFFIAANGYIVTNNHVVDGADKITVRTQDDRTYSAKLIGRDPDTDLAVLKVEGHDFPFVNFEDRGRPRVGDWVVAVGNPFNLGGTATAGIVSALDRPRVSGSSYVDYMQIDAPINRGNSGGPTFDLEGRVVGVNTAIFSPSGGSVGIGFDIPADIAAGVAHQLIADGKGTRGYIGATIQDITPEIAESLGLKSVAGALVAEVTAGGPADRAGLRPGDLVLRVDAHAIRSATDLTRQVALARPRDEIRLDVRRDGAPRELIVRSWLRPGEDQLATTGAPNGAPGSLGLLVAPNPAGGVKVERVLEGSDAARKGLRAGDIIERIGDRRIATAEDVSAAIASARAAGRKDALLLVRRQGHTLFLPVETG